MWYRLYIIIVGIGYNIERHTGGDSFGIGYNIIIAYTK